MKPRALDRKKLGELLAAAQSTYRVLAPVSTGGRVELGEYTDDSTLDLDYGNFELTVKGVLFPQREVLCTYRGDEVTETLPAEQKVLLFGVRPCDARAFALMDLLFGEFGGTTDPYYLRRRRNTLVVSLACREPAPTCFCTSVGGDPCGTEGADIAATDVGEALLFEPQTEKGQAFLDEHAGLLREPQAAELEARDKAAEQARKKVPKGAVPYAQEKLARSFDHAVWESVSRTCLGCGLCTYQCPTCHCFDVSDEKVRDGGKRVRTWDSCQYALFTHHASGHNPRPARTQRMRQRILHKFVYTVDNLERVFCVGCGRCVRNCPVNLDIRETLRLVSEAVP
jgi:ferredoxin